MSSANEEPSCCGRAAGIELSPKASTHTDRSGGHSRHTNARATETFLMCSLSGLEWKTDGTEAFGSFSTAHSSLQPTPMLPSKHLKRLLGFLCEVEDPRLSLALHSPPFLLTLLLPSHSRERLLSHTPFPGAKQRPTSTHCTNLQLIWSSLSTASVPLNT